MFNIDLKSGIPIYKQVVEGIKEQIFSGEYQADSMLPSIRNISATLRINPNTIKKAYMILEQEGYIYRVQGKGCYVKPLEDRQLLQYEKEIELLLEQVIQKAAIINKSEDELIKKFQEIIKRENDK